MSEVFAGIAKINGIAASVLALIPGGQPFAAAAAASSAFYSGLAQLTADPPRPPSQLKDVTIGAVQPMPYAVGRCELVGQLVHTEAHGRDREGVPNPWRTDTIVLTTGGPVVSIDNLYANKNEVTFGTDGWEVGYYDKYLRSDVQLGATPEPSYLNSFRDDTGSPPSFDLWGPSHKISGMAAMQFSMLLDSEETQFRSGAPNFSAVGRWTKQYDPRLDDTYSGGIGAHRLGDETTYQYSLNGVIQALTYAYGRYQNGKLVIGGGLPVEAIDVDSFVAAANVADANGWTSSGVVFENGENGEIWNNIKLMLQTASAWPTNDAGILRCLQRRPIVTVDTITEDDLEGPCSVLGMKAFKDGKNTIIPTILSEANEWSEVPIDAVEVPTLVAAQGETRSEARTYKLVTDPNQGAALAALDIYDTVEIDPISLTVGRRFISYPIGVGFNTDLPSLGLNGVTVVLISKSIDPATGRVLLGLKTDTTGKHAFALGQTATAPPQPALTTNAELDQSASDVVDGVLRSAAISGSYVSGFTSAITITEEADATWTAVIPTHNRVYANPIRFPTVSVDAATITGLAASTRYRIYYDDARLGGGAVTVLTTTDAADAAVSETNPYRHVIAVINTPAAGETADPANPSSPPGSTGPDDGWDGTGSIP